MPGAAALATRAAYRAGAGLVTLACVPAAIEVAQRSVPEATFLRFPRPTTAAIAEAGVGALRGAARGVHAVAVGPGLGRARRDGALVRRAGRASRRCPSSSTPTG